LFIEWHLGIAACYGVTISVLLGSEPWCEGRSQWRLVGVGVGDRFVEVDIDDVSRFGITSVTAGLAEPLEICNDRSPFLLEVGIGHPAILLEIDGGGVDVERL
jgi:hypothetical protein